MQIAMLAADFTPGEADALRRAMAAWKRRGGLSPFHQRLVGRMVEKGYELEYAERIFKQIQGFGEYGFPESHAAGFALLAYVRSWIKRHHPDAFLCGLLNASRWASTRRRSWCATRASTASRCATVDVTVSGWESALEEGEAGRLRRSCSSRSARSARARRCAAVRLGLNRINGLAEEVALRIVAARAEAPFAERRRPGAARPPRRQGDGRRWPAPMRCRPSPAIATRRRGRWPASTPGRPRCCARRAPARTAVAARAAERGRDHARRLPLARPHPEAPSAVAAARAARARSRSRRRRGCAAIPHGRLARASGLVTHRQRPETAKGTVFVTLEDETGAVNVIVWPRVAEAQRKPLLGATLLTVYGQWQRQGEGDDAVMHLLAARMIDHTPLLQGLVSRSRDFR